MKKAFFALTLGSLLFCFSSAVEAQKVHRIGVLVGEDRFLPTVNGFTKKMAELGYTEADNIKYDFHNARSNRQAMENIAQKLVQEKPHLIVTSSATPTEYVAKATKGTDIPVVFLSAGNPLRFVKGYASSGNNLTGISASVIDLVEKRMELLRELDPRVKRIASFNDPSGANYQANMDAVREAAKKLGFKIIEINVASREALERAMPTITRKRADAILLPPDAIVEHIDLFAKQSVKEKLPLIVTPGVPLEEGGLATYGHDYFAMGEQGAVLVVKVLKGARPMDLPIEQPSKLKLVINLNTAKAIGLKIPKEILLRADEVIE